MAEALLGFGGNVGDVRKTLNEAVALFADGKDVTLRFALVRLPHAALGRDRPAALHQPGDRRSTPTLSPRALLDRAHERRKRVRPRPLREQRWGPRPVDIDLLSYDDLVDRRAGPDPAASAPVRARLRAGPADEIVPGRVIAGRNIKEALAALDDRGIERLPPLPRS